MTMEAAAVSQKEGSQYPHGPGQAEEYTSAATEGAAYEEGDSSTDEGEDDDNEADLEAIRAMGVEDADWDMARGDFTKLYNRSRQVQSVAQGQSNASTPLPAMNNSRKIAAAKEARQQAAASANAKSNQSNTGAHQAGSGEGSQPGGIGHSSSSSSAGGSASSAPHDHTTAQLSSLSQYASRISLSGSIDGAVPRKANSASTNTREKDKADRATSQQVLDPRTLLILFKMLQRTFLHEVNGVISTGKEANVYHASMPPPLSEGEDETTPADQRQCKEFGHVAIKIYKTSILVFKDRHQYVSGEFRFRNGYTGSNPRKMVKTWAEKEARNLKRLVTAGMRAPKPLELRDHVLVMEFLGDESGWASPRLKDAEKLIDQEDAEGTEGQRWEALYREMLVVIRVLWWHCHLVHADLSEYNVLYHENHLWIIDVSQSVEHDHPKALDFLRADISHVEDYFAKRGGVDVLGLRKVFDWVLKEPSVKKGRRGGGKVGIDQQMEDFAASSQEEPEIAGRGSHSGAANSTSSTRTVETRGTGPFALLEMREREAGESEEELMAELAVMMEETQRKTQEQAEAALNGDDPQSKAGPKPSDAEDAHDAASDDAVFRSAYIPRTLNEVHDPERDIQTLKKEGGKNLIYAGGVTGLGEANAREQSAMSKGGPVGAKQDQDGVVNTAGDSAASGLDEGSDDDSDDDSSDDDSSDDDGDESPSTKRDEDDRSHPRGHRHEDKEAKKLRKNAVKEEQKERRKNKMSKKEKTKKIKKATKGR
ncbi:unnamed protein product [Jaminaea pallidilutea]